ncbi:MAG: tetratricopeptide repeat protein, partial [Pyrinomonadaceae bacterium]|nr:tetratricopeptide repeat protein [Pyrinomonadaceae bacterium]
QEDLKKAIKFYNQALQIDPNYALAHEGLATVYMVMESNSQVPPGTAAPNAEFHAVKALELDDSLAGAYLVLGTVKTMNNYDLATRETYYQQALIKNPNYRTARLWLSNNYTVRGEFEKAEAELFRVREIDPLSLGVQLNLAELYYYWRKPDKAIEQAELMLVAFPGESYPNTLIAQSYAQKGMIAEATTVIDKTPADNASRVVILAAAGRIDEARRMTESLAKSVAAKNNPYFVGCAFAVSGEKEKAFEWLEKSYNLRQADLVSIKIDPMLDSLRGDARFQDLLRRVNLAD